MMPREQSQVKYRIIPLHILLSLREMQVEGVFLINMLKVYAEW